MTLSYTLVVPPGWQLLPVRDRTDDELRTMISDHYRELPRDSAGPFISRLADAVIEQARRARDTGVIDLLFPLGTPWGAPVTTSIAVAIGPAGGPRLAGEIVETEAGEATRSVTDLPTEGRDRAEALRRLEFSWPLPDGSPSIMYASATIVGIADPELAPLVDALTELSDVILSTIRWQSKEHAA